MSTPTGPEETTTSSAEASGNQGLDITESHAAIRGGLQEEELKAPAHGPKEATTSMTNATPSSTTPAEMKLGLGEVSETLRVDAEQGAAAPTTADVASYAFGKASSVFVARGPGPCARGRHERNHGKSGVINYSDGYRSGKAVEEMKKRAARYRETPKDNTDEYISTQMEGLQIDEKLAVYEEAFASHPVAIGKAISKMEREETDRNGDSTLVYGEITFKTLALALDKIKTKYGLPGVGSSGKEGVLQGDGGAFYDIGSGTGKPVIAAAILHSFQKTVGIEILEGLHATSMEILKQWEGGLRDRIGHQPPTSVEFVHGDALDLSLCDWTDGDVVFANSTCFDDALMLKLASAATAMRKGAIFITLTKRIPAAYFTVLEHEMFPMSWGSATVYISQKTTDPFGDPNKVDSEVVGVLAGDQHRLGTAGSVYSVVGVSGRGFDIDVESERTE